MTTKQQQWYERFRAWRLETEQQLELERSMRIVLEERIERLEVRVAKLEAKPKRKPPAVSTFSEAEVAAAREVLNKLNEHAGSSLRFESAAGQLTQHVKDIVSRLRKGATSWEMRLVAWHKAHEFTTGEQPLGRRYCRPATLYCDRHWDAYLDDAAAAYAEAEDCPVDVARRGQATIGELVAEIGVVT